MDLHLNGHVAVVTGASKGVGLAVTRTLLDEGARVVAASRTRTPELDALDGEVVHLAADLMEPEAPAAVVARAVEVFGGLDVMAERPGTDRDTAMTITVPDLMQLRTGRFAEPDELAAAVALLASPLAASTTGTNVVVDSGFLKEL